MILMCIYCMRRIYMCTYIHLFDLIYERYEFCYFILVSLKEEEEKRSK